MLSTILGWIFILVGVGLVVHSFRKRDHPVTGVRERYKAVNAALGALLIGIGVLFLDHSYGWWAIAAGLLGLLFSLLSWGMLTRLLAVVATLAMVVFALIGANLDLNPWDSDNSPTVASSQTTTSTTEAKAEKPKTKVVVRTKTKTVKVKTPVDTKAVADQLNAVYQGFDPGELTIGQKAVNWKQAEERGTAGFSQRTLKSPEQVGQFLKESSAVSKAAQGQVAASLRKAGYGKDELKRALSGAGYFPVQPKVASQVLGTTYYNNDKVYEAGTWRQVGPNDVIWVYLSSDGKIVAGASVRADCANPKVRVVRPVRPNTPPAAPIECFKGCVVPKPPPPKPPPPVVHNPPPPPPPPPPEESGKQHTDACVVMNTCFGAGGGDPNRGEEASRPNELDSGGNIRPSSSRPRPATPTTQPPRPPGGTSDGGGHGDSGSGAVTTVPTPTTVAPSAPPPPPPPAPPAPVCTDPLGAGLC